MSSNFAPVINDPQNKSETDHVTDNLPADDVEVRLELRKLGFPATYTGEGNQERRARLQAVLSEQKDHISDGAGSEESDEEFFTPGDEKLAGLRTQILHNSVKKASERVARQKANASLANFTKVLKHRRNIAQKVNQYGLIGSYTMRGNSRMLSRVRYNSSEQKVACSSWEGNFYILQKDETGFFQETHRSARGYHAEMATVAWSPTDANLIVSGGGEGKTNIWKIPADSANEASEISPVHTNPEAHAKRIAQVGFHPSGDFYTTTSFDSTWRLWDVREPETELYEQEGHAKEVFSSAFHPDGSLLATGGLDAICLLWDLRSGRSIASYQGHVKGIYSMDFAPNGYHLATGSGDNSVKIWDLRKGRTGEELFSIPAHTKIVSDVRFIRGNLQMTAETSEGNENSKTSQKSRLSDPVTDENDANPERLGVSGTCLVTSSYDNTVKVWSADNWVNIKTLVGHTDRVSSCDIRSDGEEILSCGWDRTLRSWGSE